MDTDFHQLLSEEIPEAAIVVTPHGEILHLNQGVENLQGQAARVDDTPSIAKS